MPLETHGLKEDSFPQVRIIDCSPLRGKLLEKIPLTGSQNSGDSALCPASHMNWLHDPITDHSFHPDCFAGFLYQGHPQHRQSQTVVFVHAFHCLVACVLASHQEGSCQGTPSMTCWCQSAGFVWGVEKTKLSRRRWHDHTLYLQWWILKGKPSLVSGFWCPNSTQPRSHLRSVRCESMAGAAGTCLRSVSWTAQFRCTISVPPKQFPFWISLWPYSAFLSPPKQQAPGRLAC